MAGGGGILSVRSVAGLTQRPMSGTHGDLSGRGAETLLLWMSKALVQAIKVGTCNNRNERLECSHPVLPTSPCE